MRVYKNQASGLQTIIGPIKSISDDGLSMVVSSETRDTQGVHPIDFTINSAYPLTDENYRVGKTVTCTGYQSGKNTINADAILMGNSSFTVEDLAIVTGFVKRAKLNEEKNEDGTPKVNKEGKPKKPHFDVTITTKEPDGSYVNHRIKIYDGNNVEAGKKTPIDRAKAMFGKFDKDNNRMYVSVVTQPGRDYTIPSTGEDGKEYLNKYCDHMGYKAIDITYIDEKTRERNNGDKPAPSQTAPTQTPPQSQPAQGSGFENNDIEMDDMDMFN